MKKFKSLKLFLLGALAAGAAIATPVLVTACGSSNSDAGTVNTNTNVSLVEYNAKQTKKTANQTQNSNVTLKADAVSSDEEIALDPNRSEDALNKANQTFKNLSKDKLQQDFDKVLTKFYNIYEFEYEFQNGDSETEIDAELLKVTVDEINSDLTVKVTAQFKVETETEDEKTDKEDKKVEMINQQKTFTISPMFATNQEIQFLTSVLEEAKNQESKEGGFELDVEDLYELYVGDKKDNEKSIFEEVEAFTTDSKLGGLLGYKIKLNDLKYEPENSSQDSTNSNDQKQNNNSSSITGDTELFAPSFSVREYFKPNEQLVEGIDFSFDYAKLSQKTEDEIKALTKDNINDIFVNINEQQKNQISSVAFEDDAVNNAINLTIEVAQQSSPTTPTETDTNSGDTTGGSETEGTSTGDATDQTEDSTAEGETSTTQTVSVLLQINKLWLKVNNTQTN
ncbi:MAG: hypothetical protein K2J02_01370 [Malacoplasma sp.]|nr:hypothetical protein [Malacoplasma sp.]MDE6894010.1 hypothetical protein [Malacoplasma sp.]MDE7075489.1 hypothetical protein [Malacoplasma sp.]